MFSIFAEPTEEEIELINSLDELVAKLNKDFAELEEPSERNKPV